VSDKTKIEWTDATWNPVVGCSIVSPGCTNCYAMKAAWRHQLQMVGRGGSPYLGTTMLAGKDHRPVWSGTVKFNEGVLDRPLRWSRPRRIFVNSMSDLFHDSVPDEWIDKVFAVMALASRHTFQVLTKRAERMRAYCSNIQKHGRWLAMEEIALRMGYEPRGRHNDGFDWLAHHQFLPNVWLGVSVEDQARAVERIPHLLATPAAVRFISAEPLLGPLDLFAGAKFNLNGLLVGEQIDWVIAGGESGPNARPMHPDWVRSLRDQCAAAGVSFFFKQWGEWAPSANVDPADRGGHHVATVLRDGRVREWQPDFPESRLIDTSMMAMLRVGKKAAGALLDGKEHREFPR